MALLVPLIAYLALLLLLAVVSATETAIHTTRELQPRLESTATGGVARKLRLINANPFAQLQRTLLLSATLNLVLAALGLHLVTGPIRAMGVNPWLMAPVLFLTTVILGDVVPKFLAARSPSSVLLGSLRLLDPLRPILDPLSNLADRSADTLLRWLVPRKLKTRLPMTRDEFETLVEMREEQGQLDAAEAAMIREALDIERLTVRDCMTPRVDLTLMSAAEAPARVMSILDRAAGRWVVIYGETPDAVEGVIDTLEWRLNGRPDWRSLPRQTVFVPETMPVLDALEQHLKDSVWPVLIADEYGGLEGMLTQEDLADWFLSEAAPWLGEDGEVRDLGEGRYLIDGGARIDEICNDLGVDLPSGGLDTIGGLVFNHLEHVPKAGERVEIGGVEIKVRRVVRARVLQVELRIKRKAETGTPMEAVGP